jgi:glyoxylase-like metal-dependent hydrolase (beta-lactamase superfamily II)
MLGARLVLALALVAAPSVAAEAGEMFDVVRLADGVYAGLVKARPPTYVFANSLIVIGTDAVLVVDTQQSPSAAEDLVSEVRALTELPVRFVVNTHWHGDHVYGNETYRRHYPGVLFLGQHRTREGVLGPGVAYREEELRTLPESIREREEMLASGKLTEVQRERVEYSRSARTRYLGELRALTIVPPDVTFASSLTLHLGGGLDVEVHHLGPAHTAGDVVVYLPREKILEVGDLLEDAFPYFGHAYPAGWAQALERIGEFDANVLLPSHGPVLRDRELLDVETRLVRALVAEVQRAVEEGKSLEDTRKQVTLDEFRSFFTGDAPERLEGFQQSVGEAVERAYREARGEIKP